MLWQKLKQLQIFDREEQKSIYDMAWEELANFPPSPEVEEQQDQVQMEVTEGAGPWQFSQWEGVEDNMAADDDEVERCLQKKTTLTDNKDRVLTSWKQNAKTFPMVARLATSIECCSQYLRTHAGEPSHFSLRSFSTAVCDKVSYGLPLLLFYTPYKSKL